MENQQANFGFGPIYTGDDELTRLLLAGHRRPRTYDDEEPSSSSGILPRSSRSRSQSFVSSEDVGTYSSESSRMHYQREEGSERYGKYYDTSTGVCRRVDIDLHNPEAEEFKPILELELPNKHDIRLIDIPAPKLTPEEELLPAPEKYLRVLLRKCQSVKCYNFLSADEIANIVEPIEGYIPMTPGKALFQGGEGPHEFYLTWEAEIDKIEMLSQWLTQEIMDGEVEEVDYEFETTLVSVFSAVDGLYYRAQVLNVNLETECVDAFLVDIGRYVTTSIDKIKALPEQLTDLASFAFRCRLADIDYSLDPKLDYYSRKDFLTVLRGGGTLTCSIKNCVQQNPRIWAVFLKKGDPEVNVNTYIRSLYYDRKRYLAYTEIPEEREEISAMLVDYDKPEVCAADSNIREYGCVELKGLRTYRVTYVESPSVMFVQHFVEADHGYGVMSLEAMQVFYNALGDHEYRLATPRALINRCYAWKDLETNHWERVRVVDANASTRTARIYLVDLGQTCEVEFDVLRELVPRFLTIAARGCRAYLVDVKPINAEALGEKNWSEESCREFRKLTLNKTFHGIIIEKTELAGNSRHKTVYETFTLGLVLVDKNSEVKYCLNAILCNMGLAESCGVSSGILPPMLQDQDTGVFDDMKKRVTEGEAAAAEVKDLKPAQPQPEPEQPEFSLEMMHNAAEAEAIFENPTPGPVMTRIDHQKKCKPESTRLSYFYRTFLGRERENSNKEIMDKLPVAIRLRLAMCHITHITSPSCFYIQMVDKIPQLKTMMAYLRQQVAHKPPLAEDEVTDGRLVAVFLLDEIGRPSWHRAIIKHAIYSIKLVKVILLDFGNEVSIKYSTVRSLPDYFFTIPGFALRVHLDVKNLRPFGGIRGWSSDAADAFRKYLAVWEVELPAYYVWKREGAAIIQLNEFNQDVVLNPSTGIWELGRARDVPHEKHMQRAKSEIMMQNLFVSIGVDIVYEVLTDKDKAYGFEKVWNVLINKGLATLQRMTDD